MKTRSITIISSALLITASVVGCGDSDLVDVNSLKQAASTVYKSSLKGGGAMAKFGDSLSGGHVDVWESGTGLTAGAFLSYGLYSVDPTSEVCITDTYPPKDPTLPPPPPVSYCYYTRQTWESGWGTVPAQDVRVGQGSAVVKTQVQAGADFYIERCVFDMASPLPPSCTAGSGGLIELTFSRDGLESSKRTGTEEYQWGPYLHRTSGIFTTASASVAGTLLGQALSGVQGQLHSSSGASISREISRP